MDFRETWMMDGYLFRKDPINFWFRYVIRRQIQASSGALDQ